MLQPEHIIQYIIAACSGFIGATAAYYKLRGQLELSIQARESGLRQLTEKILEVETGIGERLEKLEAGAVLLTKCDDCKDGWATKIEIYHAESLKDAENIKQLAALEMLNIKQRLEFLQNNFDGVKKTLDTISDRQLTMMTSVATLVAANTRWTDEERRRGGGQ